MKQVRIAELKARLSEHLRAVRNGETIAVLDSKYAGRAHRAHTRGEVRCACGSLLRTRFLYRVPLPSRQTEDSTWSGSSWKSARATGERIRRCVRASSACTWTVRLPHGMASHPQGYRKRARHHRESKDARSSSHPREARRRRSPGRRAAILALAGSLELIDVDAVVLDRAAHPMPTELGTLDAIHLATALLWKDMTNVPLVMATIMRRWRLVPGRMASRS